MSEVKKIATRESYGNALAELGAEKADLVVLDADLAGATKTGVFKKAFPERHIRDMLYNTHILHPRNAFVKTLFRESYGSFWYYFRLGIDKTEKIEYDKYTKSTSIWIFYPFFHFIK